MMRLTDFGTRRVTVIVALILSILLTLAFIFGNSMRSKEESSDQSGAVVEVVKPIVDPNDEIPREDFEFSVRKLAHFSEFCLLGLELSLLAVYIFGGLDPRNAVCAAFVGLCCANADELLQKFYDRGSEVSDVFIDFGGVILGVLLGYALVLTAMAAKKRKKKKTEARESADCVAEQ